MTEVSILSELSENTCDLESNSVNINFNALCYLGLSRPVAFSIMYSQNDFISFIIFQNDTEFHEKMTSFPNVDKSVDCVENELKIPRMTSNNDTVVKTCVVIYRLIF